MKMAAVGSMPIGINSKGMPQSSGEFSKFFLKTKMKSHITAKKIVEKLGIQTSSSFVEI
jgi:hypothetical protein